jgi:exodeoxyribonuclease VII small subunit
MAESRFEKDLERLEQVVEALEAGGLTLDESLKRFEEGVKLARRCEKALTEAERRIEILVKNAKGEITAEPFAEEDEACDVLGVDEAPAPVKKPEPRSETAEGPAEESGEEEEGGMLF